MKPIFIALIFPFCSLTFAALSYRALFNDGAYWFFKTLHNGRVFWDANLNRITDSLPLLPVTLITSLFQITDLRIPIIVGSLGFLLHPFLSLFICYLILKKEQREELFIFIALSFASSILSIQIFAVACVQVTISIFWPLFLLTISKKLSLYKVIVICILLAGLAFSYEAAIGFISLELLILGYRRFFKKEVLARLPFYISILSLITVSYRFKMALSTELDYILDSHSLDNTYYYQFALIVAATLLINFIINKFNFVWKETVKYLSYLFIFYKLINFSMGYYINTITDGFHFVKAFGIRLYSGPTAFAYAVGILAYMYIRKNENLNKNFIPLTRNLAIILIFTGTLYDISQTIKWRRGIETIKTLSSESFECKLIDPDFFNQKLFFNGIWSYPLPFINILLDNSYSVKRLLLTNLDKANPSANCLTFNSAGVINPSNPEIIIPTKKQGKFIFSDTLKEQPIISK